MPTSPRNGTPRKRFAVGRLSRPTTQVARRAHRNTTSFVAAALLLTFALVGCMRFIPDQAITDPFGLDQAAIAIPFGPADAALAPLAVEGQASETLSFADYDSSLPVTPHTIDNQIGLATAVLDDPNGPATITLTNVTLTLQVWHGAADYASAPAAGRAEVTMTSPSTVVLNREACTATGCVYEVDGVNVGDIRLTGDPLARFLTVVTDPPTPNQGHVSVVVEAEENALAGSTLSLVLDAARGAIRF